MKQTMPYLTQIGQKSHNTRNDTQQQKTWANKPFISVISFDVVFKIVLICATNKFVRLINKH